MSGWPTRNELIAAHGPWGEHPAYRSNDWRIEVANGDTRLGYWEWVINQLAAVTAKEMSDSAYKD